MNIRRTYTRYLYKKESENFYGIYEEYSNVLITHKTSKRGAEKLVNLMNMAFDCGVRYNDEY